MLIFFFFLALLFQSLAPTPSTSQNNYLVRHYTVENGLPVNAVSDIAQDKNGYLYFVTLNGLSRYDGYEFVTFNSSNSEGIVSDRFTGLLITSSGDMWLPTESGSLTLYRNNRFKTYTDKNGVKGQIFDKEEGKNGELWLATSAGLKVFDRKADQFISPHNALESSTEAIEPMKNGGVFAVNQKGLVRFLDGEADILLKSEDFPISSGPIMDVVQTSNGTIWMLGAAGLFSYSPENGAIDQYYIENRESFISWNLYELQRGMLLTTSHGFYEVETETKTLRRLHIEVDGMVNRPNTVTAGQGKTILFGNQVVLNGTTIFETDAVQTGFVDREGSIWVASARNGLFQLRESMVSNITTANGQPVENTYPIIQTSNGEIWAGSLLSGVYRFTEKGTDIWNEVNSSLTTNHVRFIYEDKDSTIYLGTWGSKLWEFTGDDWAEVTEYDELFDNTVATIEAMYRDKTGTLMIGTRDQTVFETNGIYQTMQDSLGVSLTGVRVIRPSDDGAFFMGTNGQGLGILTDDGSLSIITEENGLPTNFIRDIFIQSPDTLWLATENQGLARVILNERHNVTSIRHIYSRDGLMSNSLHKIIYDSNSNFWISSNNGVMKITGNELNAYADGNLQNLPVINYNQRDGMINSEANGGVQTAGVMTDDNEIWFPNQKGITVFDLAASDSVGRDGMIQPKIENVILPDSTLLVSNDETVSIPKGQRNFSIKFTAPNFAYPERVAFQYRLSGIGDAWIPANESREAVFTNLDPGTHRFDIQATTGNGNLTSASIFVMVPPYFYETTWFYLMMILMGGLLIYGGVKVRTRTLENRERNLQKRVDQQTEELQEAAEQKSRFFSGITHELKTPLSLILGPLDDLTENQKPDDWKHVQSRLQMMQRNGNRLQNLVDQILDVTKLNADAIKLTLQPVHFEKISRQIVGQFQSRLVQKKINLVIEAEEIATPIYVDREAWERILINLMSNAIKFSPSDSAIHITIKNYENEVSLGVKDQGRGIKPEDQTRVFEYLYQSDGVESAEGTGIGLFLVKGLTQQMGGRIELISTKGEGAEFIVTLKKDHSHFLESDLVLHEPVASDDDHQKSFTVQKQIPEPSTVPSEEERILVVEDNDDFRSYLQLILSETYHVSTAAEGKEALEILKSEAPDLIISDVMMPGMNGLEFVNSLRRQEPFTHLPVIFLSAKNQETDKEAGLSSGADIYLTKPIRSKMLLAQVSAVLRRERVLTSDTTEVVKDEPELIRQVREIVYRQLANPSLTINLLAEALFMSRTKLYGEWKKVSDISLNDFIKKLRLDEGKVLISEKGFSVHQASQAVGFSTISYFSTSFKKEFRVNPSEVMQ